MSERVASAGTSRPPSRGEAGAAPAKDSIAGWLDMFCTLMRVPPRERDEARAELESHLRDRTRDFMLAGLDAEDAARRAIAEVGEAAELAARYRATRVENQRRNAMQFTGIGLAAGAAVVSIAALFHSQNAGGGAPPQTVAPPAMASGGGGGGQLLLVRPSVQIAEDAARVEAEHREEIARMHAAIEKQRLDQAELERHVATQAVQGSTYEPVALNSALLATKFDGDFQDVSISDVLDLLAKSGPTPGTVQRSAIEEAAVKVDNHFSGHFKQASVPDVIAALNERLADAPESAKLDARVGASGAIEIATRGFFDRRETTLVAYDLGAVLGDVSSRSQTRDAVVMSIMQIVYPDGWKSNGGDYAEVHMVNDTMFVRAPARYHHSIRWVVGQIRPGGKAAEIRTQGVEQVPLKRLSADEVVGDGVSRGGGVKISAIPSQNAVIVRGEANAVTSVVDEIKRMDELANQSADAKQAK